MKKINAWIIAFTLLLVTLFTAGIFTLGFVKHTGKGLEYEAESKACFSVALATGDSLNDIYVHIGAVHTLPGESVTITVKYSTSSEGSSFKPFGEPITFKNEVDGVNYNWLCISSGQMKSGVSRITFSADYSLKLNEIVCVNKSGNTLILEGKKNDSDYSKEELDFAVDAVEAKVPFDTKLLEKTFTIEEGRVLGSVDNIFKGEGILNQGVYGFANEYNYVGLLFSAGSVAIFGNSAFALRLPSLLATTIFTLLAFALIRLITKKDAVAFIACALFIASGAGITLAYTGTPFAMIACALLASVYFAYRFYAKGISSYQVGKGSVNILLSGVFGLLAFAMDAVSVVPLIGVGVLLGFGFRRQRLAYTIASEKENANTSALLADYRKKTKFSVCALLIAIVIGFIFLVLGATLCYSAILRKYGVQTGLIAGIWKGIKYSFTGAGVLKTAGISSVLSWMFSVAFIKESIAYFIFSTLGLISLCGLVAVSIHGFVKDKKDKEFIRLFRTVCVLLGGMFGALIAGLIKPDVAGAYLAVFALFYAMSVATFAVWGIEKLTRRNKK